MRPREKHRGFKAINKRCSKDLQAAVDGYCKFCVKQTVETAKIATKDPEAQREALVAVIEQLPSFPVDLPPLGLHRHFIESSGKLLGIKTSMLKSRRGVTELHRGKGRDLPERVW